MRSFEIAKEDRFLIGRVFSASTEKRIHLRLLEGESIESFRLGSYLTVEGSKYYYICKLVNIESHTLESGFTERQAAWEDLKSKGLEIGRLSPKLGGNPVFYDLELEPLKMISKESSKSSDPQTIPPIMGQVRCTSQSDLEPLIAEAPDRYYVEIGTLRGIMEENVPVRVDLNQIQELHSAVFAKTGAGKTFLARILVGYMTAKEDSAALVFDMHKEYGFHPKGLKWIFPNRCFIFSADLETQDKDEDIEIPYNEISPEDVLLAIELSDAQQSAVYVLNEVFGQDWFEHLVNDRVDELLLATGAEQTDQRIREGQVRRSTMATLKRNVRTRIARLSCIRSSDEITPGKNSIANIVNQILESRTVIVEFGQFSNRPDIYAFLTNLLSRRVFETYQERIRDRMDSDIPQITVVIEEAHKFLNKQQLESSFFGQFIREARKFKMGLLIIDQRPSRIFEEVLSQIGTIFVMKMTNARDLRVLTAESEEDMSDYISEIKSLNPQEGIVIGRGTDFVQNFRVFDFNDQTARKIWAIDEDSSLEDTFLGFG